MIKIYGRKVAYLYSDPEKMLVFFLAMAKAVAQTSGSFIFIFG